ncbi:MAG: tail fiber domain-containing protein, partial [Candidatus Pacearchaeota archaeon]
SEAMRIDESGNVGIGTTSPDAELEVESSTNADLHIDSNKGDGTGVSALRWQVDGSSQWGFLSNHVSDADFGLYDYSSGTYRMVWKNGTGNVGIGTTSPQNELEVSGTINATAIKVGTTDVCQSDGTNCPTDDDTTYSASGTLLDLSGTTFSVNEGTLTDGKLCTYVSGTGIVCNSDDSDTTYTAGSNLTLDGTEFNWNSAWVTNNFIDQSEEGNLNVNSSNYWDGLNTPSDITGLDSSNIDDIYLFNDGDTATGDYTFDTDTLHIDSTNGRVGIGTTAPQNLLNVDGDGNFTGDLYVGGTLYDGSGSNVSDTYVPYTGALRNVDLGANNLTVDTNVLHVDSTSDNVGIGTTSPSSELDVRGNIRAGTGSASNAPDKFISISSDALADTVGLNFYVNDGTQKTKAWQYLDADAKVFYQGHTWSTGGDIDYSLADGDLYVKSDGNVGIGTTTPTGGKLVLEDSGSNAIINVRETGSASDNEISFNAFSDGNKIIRFGDSADIDAGRLLYDSSNNMRFYTNAAEKVRIDSDGNVGIGTTSPGGKLEIDYGNGDDSVIFEHETTDVHKINFLENNGAIMSLRYDGSGSGDANALQFYDEDSGTARVHVERGGNVGIGTTSPTSKLHIEGYGSDNNIVTFSDGTNERYSLSKDGEAIFNDGPVGIGTTNPFSGINNDGLHIDRGGHTTLMIGDGSNDGGVIQSSDNKRRLFLGVNVYDDPSNSWQRFVSDGAAAIDIISDTGEDYIRFNVDSSGTGFPTERMRIDDDGNVGIGTTSPNDALDVSGQLHVHGGDDSGYASDAAHIDLAVDDDNSGLDLNSNGELEIVTQGVEAIRIDSGQRVGIGTTNPNAPLEVDGEARLSATTDMGSNDASLATKKYVDDESGSGLSGSGSSGQATFWTGSDTLSGEDNFFWDDLNNELGIGTNSPDNRLTVLGDADITGKVGIGDASPYAKLEVNGSGESYGIRVEANSFGVRAEAAGTGVYGRDTDDGSYGRLGYAGYGVYAGGSSYDFRGSDLSRSPGGDYLCWDGSGASSIGDCSSLRKHKKNITEISKDTLWEDIMELKPVNFNWKNSDWEQGLQTGFIAEEVEEVNPLFADYAETVNETTNETSVELQGINWDGINAHIVVAVQELKLENEDLKEENEELKDRVNRIENGMENGAGNGKVNGSENSENVEEMRKTLEEMEKRISSLENGEQDGEAMQEEKRESRGLRGIFNSILGGGFDGDGDE